MITFSDRFGSFGLDQNSLTLLARLWLLNSVNIPNLQSPPDNFNERLDEWSCIANDLMCHSASTLVITIQLIRRITPLSSKTVGDKRIHKTAINRFIKPKVNCKTELLFSLHWENLLTLGIAMATANTAPSSETHNITPTTRFVVMTSLMLRQVQ